MKSSAAICAAGLLVLCPLAAEAQQPSAIILGRWACSGSTPDGLVSSQMVYNANGTTDSLFVMGQGEGSEIVEVILRTESTWRLPGDGTLHERMTRVDVIRFMVGGQIVDNSRVGSLGDDLMKEELVSGSLQITANNMSMIDEKGTRTTCVR